MKVDRRFGRETSRGRFGLVMLGTIALVAVLAAGLQFMRLLDAEHEMDAVVREDAMWAVFQTDRHIRDLHAQAVLISETANGGQHSRLLRSFDILYSRVNLLERGTFLLDLSSDGSLARSSGELSAFVLSLASQIDALDPAAPGYRDTVGALVVELTPWLSVSNEILLRANADMNALRVADRVLRGKVQDRLAWLALVLILAFLGIFGLLILQLRRMARANRHMALLQQRSGRQALRAQAASRAKSAFLAAMSHEIRTPLNGIIGSAELLALRSLPAGTDGQLTTITAQAFLLRDLIDGILDFSRLEAGPIEAGRTETDLSELGVLLTRAFAEQADVAGLDLSIRMPAVRVMVNDARLRQVLVNLIGNALKFTHRGKVQVRGELPRPDLLRIEVEDDGIGIARDAQHRLFREFSQIDDSHSRAYGGSGLGLAICHRVVQGLGGRIGVDSEPGRGSLFWLELPVAAVEDSPHIKTTDTSATDDATDPVSTAKLDVLVAEDNEVNLEVICGMLRHLGQGVRIARNGQEAVDATLSQAPDLILMDMQMPVMDGLQATRLIRLSHPDLPIIGVTANAFAEDRRACLAAGMSAFLPKPVTTSALYAAISRFSPASCAAVAALPPLNGPETDPLPRPIENHATDPKDDAPGDNPTWRDPGDAGTQQLQELIEAMGSDLVSQLVDRFDTELAELRISLVPDGDTDAAAQDEVLHSFKGAALTLGMSGSGEQAQRLRSCLPIGAEAVDALIALAQRDIRHARSILLEPAP